MLNSRSRIGLRGGAALALVTAVAIAVIAGPAAAQAPSLACGDVVSHDVVLTASLTGCSSGLVIGADDVTIDLNGHSIQGTAVEGSVGVEAVGRSDVTVRNGTIRGFAIGVQLVDTVRSVASELRFAATGVAVSVAHSEFLLPVDANVVSGNVVFRPETGIRLFGTGDRVDSNTIAGASGPGIFCRGGGVTLTFRTRISGNRVTGSREGISQLNCGADVLQNSVMGNSGDGILQIDSIGTVVGNSANVNGGTGIRSIDSHARFIQNTTNANAGDGLFFSDFLADHGPFFEVTGHRAFANGGYGVFTSLLGVLDGGGNRAIANRAGQCVGISCS